MGNPKKIELMIWTIIFIIVAYLLYKQPITFLFIKGLWDLLTFTIK